MKMDHLEVLIHYLIWKFQQIFLNTMGLNIADWKEKETVILKLSEKKYNHTYKMHYWIPFCFLWKCEKVLNICIMFW